MSILFYHRPDYLSKANGPINSTDCARYLERAKNSVVAIPPGLSFENVINNKCLPPCTVDDFMDYLVYIEHNAENLQFYLWYKDYVKRFDTLPETEKIFSPKWVPEKTQHVPGLSNDPEKNSNRDMIVTAMMGLKYDNKNALRFAQEEDLPRKPKPIRQPSLISRTSGTAPSVAETIAISLAEAAASSGMKWQPFTIQPHRDEMNCVMRHYLAFSSPRELNLSHKDRALCLHALQHTTHPSALRPAILVAEAALRGQSHPNFIRWSISNSNQPRVFFVRTMGTLNISFGFVIAMVLTLSNASRWWRITAAFFWFLGISTLVAGYKGLCVILYQSKERNLKPWEQDSDRETDFELDNETSRNSSTSIVNFNTFGKSSNKSLNRNSALKKSTMKAFGPSNNDFENEIWVERYRKKNVVGKIFEKSVWVQDETLRLLQNRIVLGANLWAGVGTVILTVAFVAIPKGNFY